jgi:hypothetical protein
VRDRCIAEIPFAALRASAFGAPKRNRIAALPETREQMCHFGDQCDSARPPALVVVTAPCEKEPSSRIERFSKSTSPQRSATSSARRRPAHAAVRNKAGVLFAGRRPASAQTSSGRSPRTPSSSAARCG